MMCSRTKLFSFFRASIFPLRAAVSSAAVDVLKSLSVAGCENGRPLGICIGILGRSKHGERFPPKIHLISVVTVRFFATTLRLFVMVDVCFVSAFKI